MPPAIVWTENENLLFRVISLCAVKYVLLELYALPTHFGVETHGSYALVTFVPEKRIHSGT